MNFSPDTELWVTCSKQKHHPHFISSFCSAIRLLLCFRAEEASEANIKYNKFKTFVDKRTLAKSAPHLHLLQFLSILNQIGTHWPHWRDAGALSCCHLRANLGQRTGSTHNIDFNGPRTPRLRRKSAVGGVSRKLLANEITMRKCDSLFSRVCERQQRRLGAFHDRFVVSRTQKRSLECIWQ